MDLFRNLLPSKIEGNVLSPLKTDFCKIFCRLHAPPGNKGGFAQHIFEPLIVRSIDAEVVNSRMREVRISLIGEVVVEKGGSSMVFQTVSSLTFCSDMMNINGDLCQGHIPFLLDTCVFHKPKAS